MKRVIILIAFLLLGVLAAALLYFSNLRLGERNDDKVLSYIPADAAMVFGFKNEKSFYDILKDYKGFEAVLGNKKFSQLSQLQNLLLQNQQLANLLEAQNTFLSFHKGPPENTDLLLLAATNYNAANDIYNLFLVNKYYGTQKAKIAGKEVIRIYFKPINQSFYLYINKRFAIGSFSASLLQKCLDSKEKKISPAFISEISVNSRKNENSPLNLFINHTSLPAFLLPFFKGKMNGASAVINQLTGFSTLNLNFKNEALMFNGIASVTPATKNYLTLFLHQSPVPTTILKAFPASTANYIAYGLSDYKQFCDTLHSFLQKRGQLRKLINQFDLLKANTGIDIDRDIKQYIANEFATFQLADQQKLALIKVTNGSRLASSLSPISIAYSDDISQFKNSNIFYYYFGDPMQMFSRPYYCIVDNYLIIANAPSTLQQFLSDYSTGQLLYKTPQFVDFNQYIANQSNISYFAHNKNSKAIVKSVLNQNLSKAFDNNMFGLRRFYGLSYQWSANGRYFFTNMYASFADTGKNALLDIY